MTITNPRIETQEDLDLVKSYTLLPMLLDMLARDMEAISRNKDKIIIEFVLIHLAEVEARIFSELRNVRKHLKERDIKILTTKTSTIGLDVEYKVRGYIHHFYMLRSLVKADLIKYSRLFFRK